MILTDYLFTANILQNNAFYNKREGYLPTRYGIGDNININS